MSGGAYRWPLKVELWGIPIPDLRRIAQDDWIAAVRPLYDNVDGLNAAIRSAPSVEQWPLRWRIAEDQVANPPPPPRPPTQVSSADLQLPDPDARVRPKPKRAGPRQISMRLSVAEYARLVEAARIAGLKPTQLARTFVLNGTRRLLYEAKSQEGDG